MCIPSGKLRVGRIKSEVRKCKGRATSPAHRLMLTPFYKAYFSLQGEKRQFSTNKISRESSVLGMSLFYVKQFICHHNQSLDSVLPFGNKEETGSLKTPSHEQLSALATFPASHIHPALSFPLENDSLHFQSPA